MKKFLIVLGIFLLFYGGAFASPISQDTTSHQQQTTFVCSMHPEVKSSKAGVCPKCGMSLVEQKQKAKIPARMTPGYIKGQKKEVKTSATVKKVERPAVKTKKTGKRLPAVDSARKATRTIRP
ncbi:MAG: Copper-resistance protein CopA family [Pedobacter sp.]|jgi:hypothetical protein|nr:Copper-resistance protein CopA family [Pedobacter sp.]